MNNKILIVEDNLIQREMLETLIRRKMNLSCINAEHGRDALDHLARDEHKEIALVILDLNMPIMGGEEALPIITQSYPHVPVIMLTGSKDTTDAVRAMKNGATDFITKPFQNERMVITIQNALKLNILKKEVNRLQSVQSGTFAFHNLIGYDGGLEKTIGFGRKVAASDIPTLITGPTGSGKELLSRAIHGESHRGAQPFIAVNCGAIPSQLVESTLFGHEKGSFTGATDKVAGKFREADGGTIFLDEVGELPLETQVKLLRVLQQKEVEPVGAAHPVPVNVRIISATHRDLAAEVEKRTFREDLYFRLNVLEVELPALKERPQDILPLAQHFIERFCASHERIPLDLTKPAQDMLRAYNWPGNVRQLENAINRALVLCDDNIINETHFSNLLNTNTSTHTKETTQIKSIIPNTNTQTTFQNEDGTFKTLETLEREAMEAALAHCDQNITQAAKILGIAKSTFYRKLSQYNIT